jgi:zinc/manganese transport system substrate-binding protein
MRAGMSIIFEPMRRLLLLALPIAAAAALLAASLSAAPGARAGGGIQVVAAENVWGSIAAQLGGPHVQVTSVITSPATDPHDYEPTAIDARTFAGAKLAIVNGIGYDPWADKLLAANPVSGRIELDVGDVVGVKAGGNPHRWYSPADVRRVAEQIARDYAKLDPKHARYFAAQRTRFETKELASYSHLIATIRRRYHGMPVGASESIFAPLAQALGLRLVTPRSFLRAVSEGAEPTAKDTSAIDRQIAKHRFRVWVVNSQNSTPDVARLTSQSKKKGIPVTTITETLSPATATFQSWQVRQLKALAAALASATRR